VSWHRPVEEAADRESRATGSDKSDLSARHGNDGVASGHLQGRGDDPATPERPHETRQSVLARKQRFSIGRGVVVEPGDHKGDAHGLR
jgi:hypothetical protein